MPKAMHMHVLVPSEGAGVLQVMQTTGQLQCEIPNANLHHFKGRFQFLSEEDSKPPLVPCFDTCCCQSLANSTVSPALTHVVKV